MRFRRPAGALYVAMVALSASVVGASVDSARTLLADGQPQQALVALEAAASEDAEARFLRGVILAELDRAGEAEEVFRELIRGYPDYPEPYNNLAVLLADSGRFDEAVETLKSALRTHPSYRTAWDNLTTIYRRLASEAYSRALNVESPQVTSVELALLGTMTGAPVPGMEPVESIQAVAVAPIGDVGEVDVEEVGGQVAAEPVAAEPAEELVPASPMVESEVDETLLTEEAEVGEMEEPESDEMAAAETVAPAEEVEEAPSPAELTAVVEAWAAAWSEQRVDDYLSFYSSSFTPSNGMALADWQASRRSRLEAPEYIVVSVALLDFGLDGESSTVTFNQSYESNTFSDFVTKTLVLIREGGSLKIVKETVSP